MSSRKTKKSQKLGSTRRYKNRNRETEERENDDGFQDPENEPHENEQHENEQSQFLTVSENQSSNESSLLHSDQPVIAGTNPNTLVPEVSSQLQSEDFRDLLGQAEVTSKQRKMGSTRKGKRNSKFEGIIEDEPEQQVQLCKAMSDEQGASVDAFKEEDEAKKDNTSLLACAPSQFEHDGSILQGRHLALSTTVQYKDVHNNEEHQHLEAAPQSKLMDNCISELNISNENSGVTQPDSNVPLEVLKEPLEINPQKDTFSEPVASLPNTTGQASQIDTAYTPLDENREDRQVVQMSQDNLIHNNKPSMAEHIVLKKVETKSSLNFNIRDKQENTDRSVLVGLISEDIRQVTEVKSASLIFEHEQETEDSDVATVTWEDADTKASTEDKERFDHCLEQKDEQLTVQLTEESIDKYEHTEFREDNDEYDKLCVAVDRTGNDSGVEVAATNINKPIESDTNIISSLKLEEETSSEVPLYEFKLQGDSEIKHYREEQSDPSEARCLTGESSADQEIFKKEVDMHNKEEEKYRAIGTEKEVENNNRQSASIITETELLLAETLYEDTENNSEPCNLANDNPEEFSTELETGECSGQMLDKEVKIISESSDIKTEVINKENKDMKEEINAGFTERLTNLDFIGVDDEKAGMSTFMDEHEMPSVVTDVQDHACASQASMVVNEHCIESSTEGNASVVHAYPTSNLVEHISETEVKLDMQMYGPIAIPDKCQLNPTNTESEAKQHESIIPNYIQKRLDHDDLLAENVGSNQSEKNKIDSILSGLNLGGDPKDSFKAIKETIQAQSLDEIQTSGDRTLSCITETCYPQSSESLNIMKPESEKMGENVIEAVVINENINISQGQHETPQYILTELVNTNQECSVLGRQEEEKVMVENINTDLVTTNAVLSDVVPHLVDTEDLNKEQNKEEDTDMAMCEEDTDMASTIRSTFLVPENEVSKEKNNNTREEINAGATENFTRDAKCTQQYTHSEMSSQTTIKHLSPATEHPDFKEDDGNNTEKVKNINTEIHMQAQTKKKKKYGSTRRPHERHQPLFEGEEGEDVEMTWKDLKNTEEIEHQIKTQAEFSNLLNEQQNTSELTVDIYGLPVTSEHKQKRTGEIDAPPPVEVDQIYPVGSENLGLLKKNNSEFIHINKQVKAPVITKIQDHAFTEHLSLAVQMHINEKSENECANKGNVHSTCGPVELTQETQVVSDMPKNTENVNHQNITKEHLEDPTNREQEPEQLESTHTCIQIEELKSSQVDLIKENVELSSSEKRRTTDLTRKGHGGQISGSDQKNKFEEIKENVNIQEQNMDQNGTKIGVLKDDNNYPKTERKSGPTEHITQEDITTVCSQQDVHFDLPSQTTDHGLSTTENPATKHPDLREDDRNSKENVDNINADIHPQIQAKKKKFGSTRKLHARHKLPAEGEEGEWKDMGDIDENGHTILTQAATLNLHSEPQNTMGKVTLDINNTSVTTEQQQIITTEAGTRNTYSPAPILSVETDQTYAVVFDAIIKDDKPLNEQKMAPVITKIKDDAFIEHVTLDVNMPSDKSSDNECVSEGNIIYSTYENVENRGAEIHMQPQTKQVKKLGLTQRPHGKQETPAEVAEGEWKDLENTEKIQSIDETRLDNNYPKTERKSGPTEHITQEDIPTVCSQQDVHFDLPSQTTDHGLSTTEHPATKHPDLREDDRNSKENVDNINADIHPQIQAKKKKFGSTRKLHARHKLPAEEEEGEWKDMGDIDENGHTILTQAATLNLHSEPQNTTGKVTLDINNSSVTTEQQQIITTEAGTRNTYSPAPILSVETDQTYAVVFDAIIKDDKPLNEQKMAPVITKIKDDAFIEHVTPDVKMPSDKSSDNECVSEGNIIYSTHENVENRGAEIHMQPQTKKVKKLGLTQGPHGKQETPAEVAEGEWKDLENTEKIQSIDETRLDTLAAFEQFQTMSEEPQENPKNTESKPEQCQMTFPVVHIQKVKLATCDLATKNSGDSNSLERRKKMGSTRGSLRVMKDKENKQEQTTEQSHAQRKTFNSNSEISHQSIQKHFESLNIEDEAEEEERMGSTCKNLEEKRKKQEAWQRSTDLNPRFAKDNNSECLKLVSKEDVVNPKTSGQDYEPQIHHELDQSDDLLHTEIELNKSLESMLNTTAPNSNISEISESMPEGPLQLPSSENSQIHMEPSSPARKRKMGSNRKLSKNKNAKNVNHDSTVSEQGKDNLDKNYVTQSQPTIDAKTVTDTVIAEVTEDMEKYDKLSEVQVLSQINERSAQSKGQQLLEGRKASSGLSAIKHSEYESNQEKTDIQLAEGELKVSDQSFISNPESILISPPISEPRPEIEAVGKNVVINASTKDGLVSLESIRKIMPSAVSTGARQKIDFEQWNEQIPDFGQAVYNVVMVGNSNVGKTSFIKRLQSGHFIPDYSATIGVDTFVHTVTFGGRTVKLYVWDTAGQERYHSITRQIFYKAQGLVLMYDITSSQSFHAVRAWISQVQEKAAPDVILMLLGNKNDCVHREVQLHDGEDLANEYDIHFMECSAATGENVSESLKTLAWLLLKQRVRKEEEHTTLQPNPQNKKLGCC